MRRQHKTPHSSAALVPSLFVLFASPPVFLPRAGGCGGAGAREEEPRGVLPPLPGLILLPCPTTGVEAVVNRHLEAGFKPGTNWCERDHSRKH